MASGHLLWTENSLHVPLCPSVGSIGHPHSCGSACKFNNRASGCKDGRLCVRCHLCPWQRRTSKPAIEDLSAVLCLNRKSPRETPTGSGGPSGVNTPDPPTVCKRRVGPDSDDFPSVAATPPQLADVLSKAPEDIAQELNSKLEWLQRVPRGYHCGAIETSDGVERDGHPLQLAQITGDVCLPSADGFAADEALQLPLWVHVPTHPFCNEFGMPNVSRDVSTIPPPSLDALSTANSSWVTSIGSVGHPYACGKACKHSWQKTGCQDGANCLDCHHCLRRGESVSKKMQCLIDGGFSAGTQGHQHSWDKACKRARPKTDCHNGASCTGCHLCHLRQHSQGIPATMPYLPDSWHMPEGGNEASFCSGICPSVGFCPSVGSFGHPLTCAGQGCKYNGKVKGCKDGRLCLRCHLCPWLRRP